MCKYIGCTEMMVKARVGEHVASVTQPSKENTTKKEMVQFRLLGHIHYNMRVLPIEKVMSRFVLEARESYWISKHNSVKALPVDTKEHGMIYTHSC